MRAVLAFLMLALAGCSGAGETAEASEDGTDATEQLVRVHNITLVDEASAVAKTFGGTFQIQEGQGFLGPLAPTAGVSSTQTHDITDLLGPGPNWVTAQVVSGDDFNLGLIPDDFGTIWTSDTSDLTAIEAVVVDANLAVAVTFLGTAGADAVDHADGVDYEVTVTVTQDPERIPSGVALEIGMPLPGTKVTFTGVDGAVPDVLVFDPDDAYVGKLGGGAMVETTLADNETSGDYVFMPVGHGSFYQLNVVVPGEPTPDARIITQVVHSGELETIEAGASHALELDLGGYAMRPLQVGVVVIAPTAASAATAAIIGPDGAKVAEASLGGPLGAAAFDFTVMGDERLVPGDYVIEYSDQGSSGDVTVQGFVIHYGR